MAFIFSNIVAFIFFNETEKKICDLIPCLQAFDRKKVEFTINLLKFIETTITKIQKKSRKKQKLTVLFSAEIRQIPVREHININCTLITSALLGARFFFSIHPLNDSFEAILLRYWWLLQRKPFFLPLQFTK